MDTVDSNGNGEIDKEEFMAMCPPNRIDYCERLAEFIDSDHSNSISTEELT